MLGGGRRSEDICTIPRKVIGKQDYSALLCSLFTSSLVPFEHGKDKTLLVKGSKKDGSGAGESYCVVSSSQFNREYGGYSLFQSFRLSQPGNNCFIQHPSKLKWSRCLLGIFVASSAVRRRVEEHIHAPSSHGFQTRLTTSSCSNTVHQQHWCIRALK